MSNTNATLCSKNKATLDQVLAVPVPRHTRSWCPVPYADTIGYLRDSIAARLGMEIESEEYGLAQDGAQLFGVMRLEAGDNEQGLAIGFRQSYNKSLALGVAVGTSVFVCDNLCFSGNDFKIVRKNTLNVWADFRGLVTEQVQGARVAHERVLADTVAMKEVSVNLRRGYAYLGVALGEGVLTPTQASVAFGDWREPRHEEFSDRNMWSLYNCVTEGLKKGTPGRMLDRSARAHDYFRDLAGIGE